MLIFLILILSEVSHTKTKKSDVDSLISTGLNPAGFLCLDKEEVSSISEFKQECDVSRLDLQLMNDQYKKCRESNACAITEQPISKFMFWGSIAIAGFFGFVAGAAR